MNKNVYYGFMSLCLITIFAESSLASVQSIEQVRDTIIRILKQNNSTALEQFNNFYMQFDRSVHLFFDRKNNQTLADHIKRMEDEVAMLNTVCNDQAFASVRHILQSHRDQVIDLLAIFKKYIGSINSVGFALKVKRFEFLLPADIKKRGHFSLFRSLHHRLMC